jgi:hypothetical protein
MAMRPRLWGLSALATELARNVRTVSKALTGVKADGQVHGHDAWYLRTALRAMKTYEKSSDQLAIRRWNGGGDELLGQLGAAANQVEEMLVRLRREPDLRRRREILKKEGGRVGELDRLFEADFVRQGPEAVTVFGPFRDRVIGGVIGELLELTEMRVDVRANQSR